MSASGTQCQDGRTMRQPSCHGNMSRSLRASVPSICLFLYLFPARFPERLREHAVFIHSELAREFRSEDLENGARYHMPDGATCFIRIFLFFFFFFPELRSRLMHIKQFARRRGAFAAVKSGAAVISNSFNKNNMKRTSRQFPNYLSGARQIASGSAIRQSKHERFRATASRLGGPLLDTLLSWCRSV